MQRPDYRDAAAAVGPRARDQVRGDARGSGTRRWRVYRPGAVPVPPGWPVGEVLLALPLPRADAHGRRPATPAAPAGFRLAGRLERPSWTLVCYLPAGCAGAGPPQALAALAGSSAPAAQAWPAARRLSAPLPRACRG